MAMETWNVHLTNDSLQENLETAMETWNVFLTTDSLQENFNGYGDMGHSPHKG